MEEKQKQEYDTVWRNTLRTLINTIKFLLLIVIGVMVYLPLQSDIKRWLKPKSIEAINSGSLPQLEADEDPNLVVDGIHVATGLAFAPGFEEVRANCTVCHNAALVTQNKATNLRWDNLVHKDFRLNW